jgi:glycosyltransferase involved in cell wall biosynthesis
MEEEKLISIITPTYNYGHLIHRLLDSILQQTYSNIEMFVIDDGSTDNTKQVIEEYFEKFRSRKYAFQYVYQKNLGRSVALNNGLKLIHGDYLVWPDADDFYAEANALKILATTLDNTTDDIGSCRALGYYVDEKNFNILNRIPFYKEVEPQHLFEDCLYFKKFFRVCPINWMIKVNVLFNEISDRNIYTEKNAGQNYQILLPVLYNRKSININKYLFKILVHSDSVSRRRRTYEERIQRHNAIKNTLINTLSNIKNMSENQSFIYKVKNNFASILFMINFSYGKKEEAIVIYRRMCESNISISLKMKICYILCFVPFGAIAYNIVQKIYRRIWRKKY